MLIKELIKIELILGQKVQRARMKAKLDRISIPNTQRIDIKVERIKSYSRILTQITCFITR
jgi:hypothetical protein